MSDELDKFLELHPLKPRWLDIIISALSKRSNGTAHVRDLGRELGGDHDIDTIESTITRRINDFCSDADDFKRPKAFDLFARVEPATYRLRSFPRIPDTTDLETVEFQERAMQWTWEYFVRFAKENVAWTDASNRKRLTAFARYMAKESGQSYYHEMRTLIANPPDLSDLGI